MSSSAESNDASSSPSRPGLLRRTFPSFPWTRLPDWLTYARCLAVPVLALVFHDVLGVGARASRRLTALVFASASFTDFLDGYLARRWRVSTAFGAFLDPVADKLAVSTALVMLTGRYGAVLAAPTAVVVAREIAVSALREWAARRGVDGRVRVGFQGKIKTAGTMLALTVLLASDPIDAPAAWRAGIAGLYLCSLVTVTSGSAYFMAVAPELLEQKRKDEDEDAKKD